MAVLAHHGSGQWRSGEEPPPSRRAAVLDRSSGSDDGGGTIPPSFLLAPVADGGGGPHQPFLLSAGGAIHLRRWLQSAGGTAASPKEDIEFTIVQDNIRRKLETVCGEVLLDPSKVLKKLPRVQHLSAQLLGRLWSEDDEVAKDPSGKEINALEQHIKNLLSPSTPHFFNTLYDLYREGADFVRGYPFSLREGAKTAISHGLWLNIPDYDDPTQLVKPRERNTRRPIKAAITMTAEHLAGLLPLHLVYSQAHDTAIEFLTRNGLECSDLETICVKYQALTNENVDKIVGFALSHHLKQK